MDTKRLLCLSLLFSALTASFCSAEDGKSAPSSDIWIDLQQGEPLRYEEVLDDLAKADVVYLAEHHTIDRHHENQEKILTDLAARGLPLGLGIEQMESDRQPSLDRFNRGEIDFEKLAKETDWANRWENYLQYRPMLEAAKKAKIPVVALNARAETIRQVARGGGVERLPAEMRKTLPGEMVLKDPAYEKYLSLMLMVHASMKPEMLRSIFEAQMARDEAMSEAICGFLKSGAEGKRKMVVLIGAGHVVYGLGTPSRVLRRMPGLRDRIVLSSVSGELRLSPAERAQARDIEITHEQLRQIKLPLGDYLSVKTLK
jgi:uncharacterized iron-regulated protein